MRPVEAATILAVHDLRKRFRGIEVLTGVSVAIARGQVTALIGSNGAGKSPLFNLVSGILAPAAGLIRLAERDITRMPAYARARLGIARTFQHPRSFGSLTVRECATLAATPPADERLLPSLVGGGQVVLDRVQGALERCDLAHRADTPA